MPAAHAWLSHQNDTGPRHAPGSQPHPTKLRPDDQVRAAALAQVMGRGPLAESMAASQASHHLTLSASQGLPAQRQAHKGEPPVMMPRGRSAGAYRDMVPGGLLQIACKAVPEILLEQPEGMPRTPTRSEEGPKGAFAPGMQTLARRSGDAHQVLHPHIRTPHNADGIQRAPPRQGLAGHPGSGVADLLPAQRMAAAGGMPVNAAVAAAHQALFEHQQQRMQGAPGHGFMVQPAGPLPSPVQMRPQGQPTQQAQSPVQPSTQARAAQQAPSPLQPHAQTHMQSADTVLPSMQPSQRIAKLAPCPLQADITTSQQMPLVRLPESPAPAFTQVQRHVLAVPVSTVGMVAQAPVTPSTPTYGVRMGRMESPAKEPHLGAATAQPSEAIPVTAVSAPMQFPHQVQALLPAQGPPHSGPAAAQPAEALMPATSAAVPSQQPVSRIASAPLQQLETSFHDAGEPGSAIPPIPSRIAPAGVQNFRPALDSNGAAPSKIAAPPVQHLPQSASTSIAGPAPSRIAAAPVHAAQATLIPAAGPAPAAHPIPSRMAPAPHQLPRHVSAPVSEALLPAPGIPEPLQQMVSRIPKPVQVVNQPAGPEPATPQLGAAGVAADPCLEQQQRSHQNVGLQHESGGWHARARLPSASEGLATPTVTDAALAEGVSQAQSAPILPVSLHKSPPPPLYEQPAIPHQQMLDMHQQPSQAMPARHHSAGPWVQLGSGPLPRPLPERPLADPSAHVVFTPETPQDWLVPGSTAGRLQPATEGLLRPPVIAAAPLPAPMWERDASPNLGNNLAPQLQSAIPPLPARDEAFEKPHVELPYMEMTKVEDTDESSSGEIRGPLTPPLGSEPEIWRSPRASRTGREAPFGELAGPEQGLARADSIDACAPGPSLTESPQRPSPRHKREAPLERQSSNREVRAVWPVLLGEQ